MIEREELVLEALPGDGMDDLAATLREAELPHEDLGGKSKRFFCASAAGEIVGYVGLEISGSDALLRSAVIFIRARRRGLGRAMIEQLLALASDYGIERVWLLTTSVPGFFAKLGFDHVDRTTVPPAIAASEEFSDLCPSTAVCMVRALTAAAFAQRHAV
jgi:N-acetylglutamate synthase-like GNAT family acetyltransferase